MEIVFFSFVYFTLPSFIPHTLNNGRRSAKLFGGGNPGLIHTIEMKNKSFCALNTTHFSIVGTATIKKKKVLRRRMYSNPSIDIGIVSKNDKALH